MLTFLDSKEGDSYWLKYINIYIAHLFVTTIFVPQKIKQKIKRNKNSEIMKM